MKRVGCPDTPLYAKKDLAKIDEEIKNYLTILDTLDKEDKNSTNLKISKDEIEKLKQGE